MNPTTIRRVLAAAALATAGSAYLSGYYAYHSSSSSSSSSSARSEQALETMSMEGNTQAGIDTIVLVHGWPDSRMLFSTTAIRLKEIAKRIVFISLPGYETETRPFSFSSSSSSEQGDNHDGDCNHTFIEAVKRYRITLKQIAPDGNCAIIAHDWGALLTYMLFSTYKEERFCTHYIALDVGVVLPKPSLRMILGVIAYQIPLNLVYSLGSEYGGLKLFEQITKFVRAADYPGKIPYRISMTWPYRELWRDILFNGNNYYKEHVVNFTPRTDMAFMFIYGKDNLMPFHSESWLERMKSMNPKNRVVGVKGDHWFLVRSPDEYVAHSKEFLLSNL